MPRGCKCAMARRFSDVHQWAVSGMYDPLDIGEYSFEEIKAAADEAKRWNTYLAVHTYNDKGARAWHWKAGAMAIDHGNPDDRRDHEAASRKVPF